MSVRAPRRWPDTSLCTEKAVSRLGAKTDDEGPFCPCREAVDEGAFDVEVRIACGVLSHERLRVSDEGVFA